jgi:hypothetical protein
MNAIRNFALAIAMFAAVAANAVTASDEGTMYSDLIGACTAFTQNDTELATCTTQMTEEAIAQIGVQ